MKLTKVIQSNIITQGAYSLSLKQKRVVYLAILRANKSGVAYITTAEFSEYYGVGEAAARKALIEQKTTILIPSVVLDHGEGGFESFVWIQEFSFTAKKDTFKVEFSSRVTKEIANLQSKFTQYNITEVGKITNPYFMRLYESISQWYVSGNFQTTPQWLMDTYQLPKSYKTYCNLKAKFLLPACKEITAKTNFMVKFVETFEGNKVVSLEFLFQDRSPQALVD